MTTRKKLSDLRAQIRRQTSKAARLEKRNSSDVARASINSSYDGGGGGGGQQAESASGSGTTSSPGANNTLASIHQQCSSDDPSNGLIAKQARLDGLNEANFSNQSSSIDAPNAYLNTSPHTTTSGYGNGNACASGDINSRDPRSSGGGDNANQSISKISGHLVPGNHFQTSSSNADPSSSVHQKNFKQKLVALIKKFRKNARHFDNEEQYRAALERELMKAAAERGTRAIDELLEEDDLDVDPGSDSEPDWDNISESSTPKPSLRPFFSTTTLDKI